MLRGDPAPWRGFSLATYGISALLLATLGLHLSFAPLAIERLPQLLGDWLVKNIFAPTRCNASSRLASALAAESVTQRLAAFRARSHKAMLRPLV